MNTQNTTSTVTLFEKDPNGNTLLLCPTVASVRLMIREGEVVFPNMVIGTLEVLGEQKILKSPSNITGIVTKAAQKNLGMPTPLGFKSILLTLDVNQAFNTKENASSNRHTESTDHAHVFRSPLAGRFYRKPAPEEPVFIEKDQIIEVGQTIGLIEVMKTFNRVQFSGVDAVTRIRVLEVNIQDGDDICRDDVIFHYEILGP